VTWITNTDFLVATIPAVGTIASWANLLWALN